jgi:ADP-ribose pyrophosphatase
MSQPEVVTLHAGRFLKLVCRGKWEYAERANVSGVVGIVAVTSDQKLLLVEQFRIPVGCPVIELPAGLAGDIPGEEHEALAAAAQRELEEETGHKAERFDYLTCGPSSAGLTSETLTLFLARGVQRVGAGGGDGSENIVIHEIPLADVPAWLNQQAKTGKLIDTKVYAGLYFISAAGK